MPTYRLQKVTAVCILHYDTQRLSCLFKERFLVAYDVLVLDGCKNTNFIKCIRFLLNCKLTHFHLLHCEILILPKATAIMRA